MTSPFNVAEQPLNISAVIRSAGERSLQACKALLVKQIPESCIHIVSEVPFESALRKTYEIGIESDDEWLMTLDADVFLRKGSVYKLFSEAEGLPGHYFQIEGLIHDKLTGMYRNAGHRMYRTKYLDTALKKIPEANTKIRPELTTLKRMETSGYPSKKIQTVFGLHDYDQFYCDIYRKAFIHANKHQIWISQLISRWKNLGTSDDDFRIALRGLYDGLISLANVKIDTRDYVEAAKKALGDLGLQEKPVLPVNTIGFKRIEAILADAGEIPNNQNNQSLEAKLERLKSRYARLGALRTVTYLFGATLSDIGAKIKKLVENGKPT